MQGSDLTAARLLAFARRLQYAQTYDEVLAELVNEVREAIGYETAWISVYLPEQHAFKVLSVQGPGLENLWETAPIVPIEHDPYLEDMTATGKSGVIEDAQTDPRVNREIVEALGNRTVINVPMTLIDEPFGAIGTGTFGDEGVRVPTDEELAYLEDLASHIVFAAARILLALKRDEARRQQSELDQQLARRQRLESLGELAGGVAHDFNNLLTVIRASAQMLREEISDPDHNESLRLIETAAISASELTARLLALGKRQQLALAPIDINQSIVRVGELFERVAPPNVSVSFVPGNDLPNVLGDARQIEQVLMNLYLNARDAMPEGGELTVETEPFAVTDEFVVEHPWANPGSYVQVTVSDTGSGIDPEALERIFDPFFSTKPASEGTGLGLAVSRGIVEQHGGMINAYSETGVGTSFKIHLPVSDQPTASGEPSEGPVAGGNERILIADDQIDVRRVIERVLARSGYDVVGVNNGAEAVSRAQAQNFDLVLLDAVMSVMGGREALERIQAARPDLPVIFVTGYGGEELSHRVFGAEGVPLLAKPFDPEVLLRTVREVLDARVSG